jgi:hypothetical protein
MNPIILHLMLPSILPALFFLVVSTPVEVLGCFTRGLIALLIAFIGVLGGLGAAIMGVKEKRTGGPKTNWWVLSALFLSSPAAALIFLA